MSEAWQHPSRRLASQGSLRLPAEIIGAASRPELVPETCLPERMHLLSQRGAGLAIGAISDYDGLGKMFQRTIG